MRKYLPVIAWISFALITMAVTLTIWRYFTYATRLRADVSSYITQMANSADVDPTLAKEIIANLKKISSPLNKIDLPATRQARTVANDILTVSQKLLEQDQKYLIILQNSDELRATGGFLGSYAVLETRAGILSQPKIQDIYVPDGQFQGFLEAPDGLRQYLSSGKGMRLPDANWWPDFGDSAKQILDFFKLIENQDYQGVIAINLQVVEDLLSLTGDVYLPDYQVSVNQTNFAKLARADRSQFFPGSQEKANFLNHFLKILKLQLAEAIQKNPRQFWQLLQKFAREKSLQIYSKDPEIAAIINKAKVDGQMQAADHNLYYFLVESNVGINKANRLVERQFYFKLSKQQKITINFQNSNPFAYVNYQRLYTNPSAKLLQVAIDGQVLTSQEISQRLMYNGSGKQYLEIGFLVSVLANNHASVEITLDSQLTENPNKIIIQKQSGLQSSVLNISKDGQTRELRLDRDLSIDF